uniref:M23 family metallopeptidase n=1 Tax=candidate division WOR-3 bacterium TaxID=2052148 RepID=A0A7C4GHM8_UNCW3
MNEPVTVGETARPRRGWIAPAVAGVVLVGGVLLLVLTLSRPRPRCGPPVPHPDSTSFGGSALRGKDVLATVLSRWCLSPKRIDSVYAALGKTDFGFRSMKPGDSVTFEYRGLKLAALEYRKDPVTGYRVEFDSSGAARATKFTRPVDTVRAVVRGRVEGSLWNTLVESGERPSLVVKFAEILSYEIDFLTETNDGDSFEILVDKYFVDSVFWREGRVHAVRYKGRVGDFAGFYFRTPSGHWDYYNEKGQSLRKTVLRSPLTFANVTSHFGMRVHPISRVYRMHQGVDYGAPTGTPVAAIADGTVTRAGWNNGWGNFVEVRHAGGLVSGYGHLSRYGPGIKAGRSVRQGQTVGYVGSTGVSTGPHLHFQIKQNGKFVNPLKVIPPRAEPVPAKLMPDFKAAVAAFRAELAAPPADSAR